MSLNLTIFDADFILFTATMGNKVFSDGEPIRIDNKFVYIERSKEEVFKAADDVIIRILDKLSSNYFCGFLGACKSFRKDIYPEYKANRKGREKPPYFNELFDYLIDRWKFIRTTEGLEADDAVNIVRNSLQNDYNCTIISSDKDLFKSIKGRYLNTRDLSIIETSEEDATKFFWKSMITGDVIDNIKGIPGKGDSYFNKLLDFIEDKHTNLAMEVLDRYIQHFGLCEGIDEFYKNYKCLHILDKFSNFVMPTLQSWELSIGTSKNLDLEGVK